MADDEEIEEYEYYYEETIIEEGEEVEPKGSGPAGPSGPAVSTGQPERKRVKKKIDTSKFMTPYLAHSKKMQDIFSQNKYKEKYEKHRGEPYAITTDTPELRRIKKAQNQLSEVKYRMGGQIARTDCHVDEKARDIEHAKKVSQQVSKVLYKQNWEDTKEKYLLPPDAPELVQAVKNTTLFSKKLYTADWDEDKTLYFPYSDSPELRRVAKAQKALSDINYKKGHNEQKLQFSSVADRPDIEMAKKVTQQLSDVKYREDYQKKIRGKWSQTPCYEIAVARMNADNLSDRKYQEDFENIKDQINFVQTETPEYKVNKKARLNASTVQYKADYEKSKGPTAYHTLPATENPLLRQLRVAGNALSDKLYKDLYEKSRGSSINYCDTPKFKIDNVLKNFSDLKYKDHYQKNVVGHYVGSYEDPYMRHCAKVSNIRSDKNYKADYEDEKTNCYFPQTVTQEYEAQKKLNQCKDYVYKQHPDQIAFTQVADSPVIVQAQINSKQLSDLNYKEKYEKEKFKCSIPEDSPFILQSRLNAYNLSDKWYKYDWDKAKAKKFDIKIDAIPLVAAKANRRKASDVEYKKDYEKNKGKMVGALSIQDDPKMLLSAQASRNRSDILYKKDYENSKTKYSAPLDMIPVQMAKKAQSIASNLDYKHLIHSYFYPPDSVNLSLAKKAYTIQSDVDYKSDYNNWVKGCGWVPYGSMDVEKAKKASQILNEKKYRQHPDTIKFTSVEDDPVMVQSKLNQKLRSDILYKSEGEKVIHKYSLPADVPGFIQARVNAYNLSDNYYKQGLEELKSKGYDLKPDAISIKVAKAARHAASDVQYKKNYEKQKGKLVGFRSLQDDPKLVHYMHVAKMQSEREYKKDYEKAKTKYNTPLDMVNVVAAKKAQDIASGIHYKQLRHHYTYLPDAMSIELSKKMMEIQSDNLYKADMNNWMKGIGWIPIGSLDVEKAKKAAAALNEKKYRQHPDTIKFTSVVDSPVMVQAKTNALQLSDKLYKSSGEKIIHKYHLPPDVPQFIQARCNAANVSDKYYKQDWMKTIAKGHHVLGDAISIVAAKSSRNIASDYKYKQAYEKARGKHVGFRSLQDDPKLVHFMDVAKKQSDREYKKDYEKTKTKYHTPLDMVSITAAKKSQEVATNINYKQLVHHYTYLPDAMSVELSRKGMEIQSDNVYKQDYNNWFKGIGWIPLGSLEVEKVKKAGDAISEKKYRQHPDTIKFTSVADSMELALAQSNTKQRSDLLYKAEGEKVKHKYALNPDDPNFIQARVNALNISESNYKANWIKHLAKGYDLKPDAISVKAAKASRNIASDFKYKEAYQKARGKHVGFRSLQDDPKLVHYMHVAKIQSDREYKKDYEKSKTKYHTPLDMFSVTAAKKAQEVSTNATYKQPLHAYTLLPDAMNLELSRNMMQIQSDNLYKSDFNNWLKGVGWVPIGSLDVENAKKIKDYSEKKYRQNPDQWKFSIPTDAMDQVLAKANAQTMNKKLYIDAWEKDKTKIHVMPDTPEILQSRVNQQNTSDKLYKLAWEQHKKKGYDLKPDAISIKAARASRDIASDYKYKKAYEQTRGKHIGFRSLQDDPKLVHFMHVAKMQSDREYKKNYEQSKTKFHTPVDMFSVTAAKLAQNVATNTNYKRLIHSYNLLPDAMPLALTRNMMQIQSDNVYKSEYNECLKGVGWIPYLSQEAEKNKKAMEIVSEKKYRQHPDTLKFTSLPDSMEMVLAKNNALTLNKSLYTQAWEKDKTTIHVMPDAPEFLQAKVNAINISEKKYKEALEKSKKKGYDLRADAISIKAARASRDIASDYKYKKNYEMGRGKMVGFRNLQDDPKLVHYMNVAKMQSDREYKKDYEKTKTKYHTPVTMFSVMAAKEAQAVATNVNYKRLIHKYILLPDAMNVQLAKNMNQIQSDNEYKSDYNAWYKGMGWTPIGSLDVEKSKKAMEIVSEAKYREHPSKFRFTRLTDAMDMELAKQNAQVMNKRKYIDDWEKEKTKIHVMPDTPEILQAKQNMTTFSQKQYRLGWEEAIKKGYDLRPDAISIKAAKASRDIASDFKYKTAYRKQQGHHVGFRSLQDDPKSVWAMHVAKIQSNKEYKKDFEKWKTKFNMPVDMLGFLLAKKCQTLVSDVDYKRPPHNWTCLPDQIAFVQAQKVYEIQSDNSYKADYNEFMRGVGWIPFGSQEAEKNKKAMQIVSEKKYRQHPDKLKFTSLPDSMELVLAKNNAQIMNRKLYTEAWEKDKIQIHVMPDTPEILQAKANLANTSEKLYKSGYEEIKKKGYDLRVDAISIKAAKASRDIASEFKYKAAYRKQQGHHIGFRSLQDDPKSVWAMHVAKIQSDKEYKKDFEKWKTKFNMPVDMLGFLLAKKCQTLVSDIDYKNILHKWTCLPDQNDVVQARKTYEIQSDVAYKADLQWLRGIGWSPIGSLDVEKNKRASLIQSDHKYRQHPDKIRFTSVPDSMEMTLAKSNAEIMNKRLYTQAWNKDKTQIHIMPDTPEVELAKQNKINFSEKKYREAMELAKQKGYDLRPDAISIKAARASRDIASDYKYKTAYRKQVGHHVGCRNILDDPKLVWSMHLAKIQSNREYKKDFEKWKTKFNMPVDMLDILLAKKCQTLVSDIDYRRRLHQWTCLPDQNDVIHARKAYDLQSDNQYKADLQWLKGIGWVPIGSLDVEKSKKAGDIISENKYRQRPDTIKFTSVTDSMEVVLAKANADIMNKRLYTGAWEKDKTTIHIMPDTPEITLARQNKINFSESLYKQSLEEAKKKGYDLRVDAITIKAAKASRDIASDFKYKTGYRKQLGHHVGFRNLQDDPKSVWAMHVAKIQSNREYKKDFEKWKTKFNMPVDMLDILLAKKCQTLVSDIDYKRPLHKWTCLPDQNDVIHARKTYDLQSDNQYKADLSWLRGVGWVPIGSLEVEKNKRAGEILSDHKYRQKPDSIKFTSVTDSLELNLAKANADLMNKRLYTDAWNQDKTTIHVMPDTPEIILAKANRINFSEKLYKLAVEQSKKKGYDLRSDAISIKAAKASRDIVSDFKYKTGYRKQRGHHVGFRSLADDPKSVWAMHVAKIQSDREYKKEFEKQKTKYQSPVEMLSVLLAKNCQKLVSDIDYRHHLHQWTCLPDQNDVIQAKKAYDLQSDAVYKSDLEWIRGCGWIPHESLEVKKVKNAQTILNDRMYRQPASSLKFTSVVDLPGIVLAKTNADQISESKYKEAWETDKRTIHVMPDTPEIMLSRANAINVSNKLYRMGWDKVKMIYDLKPDAIAIKAARASRDIASDYKYKKTHEKEKGHYIGAKSAKDDNKISWYLHASKLPSDLEYKKNFEKTKTKVNLPADMVSILSAKLCQTLVSDIDYRRYLHQWTCLPDQNDVIQAKKAYELQSDAVYKSDLEWIRGIGWMPNDSCEVKKVKHAQDILSERKYRTKPETMKFTAVTDRVDYVSAKQGADILNDYKYREAWNNIKTKYTAVNDSPLLLTAKEAAKNVNDKLYKSGWENIKATGYLLPKDAVQLTHAKKSSLAQSELKYKAEYIKQRGHYIGVSSLNDDPKLRWFKHINLVQNDREYQKNYQKTKSKINIPGDMVSIESAKQGQQVASNIDYRHYLHQWTCHPDQNDCIQAKKAYDLQSDAIYKSDLEWIRGCGWVPLDSVEHKKVRKAQELVNERFYKKDAQDNFSNYTHVVDTPPVVLAKLNSVITSDLKYKETFNLEKGHYIGSADTPQLSHSREMSKLTSEKLYKDSWDSSKALGYQLPPDYWPLVGAKQARLASSDIKYKELHEKEKGHYLAGGKINDFQSVVQSLQFQKMRNMLAYHKAYEDNKTKIHIPKDMLNNVLAKKCQQILSDIEYRHYLHEWTCLPDEQGVIHARKANEILSDVLYKDDLNWLKGLGCYVWDTPEIVRAKSSYNLQSQIKYTAGGKENFKNYSVVTDTPVYVTSVQSAINASDLKYKEDFNKNKDKYTTVLETVDYDRTQNLKGLFSDNIYKHAWDKVKATSYQLPPDAVPLAFAKRNKHIASQLKYREEYEKFKALYTLPKGIQDDPATARCLKVGKLPLDRLYKETYEKNKAKIHIAPDMLEIVSARETQDKVSEIDYRKYLHEWTCLPDLQLYVHARKVNEQLSDIAYKDDLHWLKGIGCFVWDTPEILHAKHAYDLRSDNKYKAKAEELKKTYTSVTDTPVYVQAVTSGKQSSDVVYHSDYEQHVRGKVTSTPNTVDLERASNANKIQSDNLYREDGVKSLPKGYTLPNDTPAITQAKKAQLIGSDVKYKEVYEHIKAKSYTLGPQDVGMVNTRKVNKILNERLYREVYHKQKDKIHTTPDTPEIRQVKATQDAISDLVYKSDYHNKLQGHMISMPFTPQTIHCRYVGEITSDNKYKEDLQWLKGLGCFLYDTPDMVRARDLRKLWSKSFYTTTAKKMLDTYSVVMDTPEYRTVQELKTHLSQFVYRAEGNKQKSIYTSVLDTPDFLRAKKGQEMQSQYLYTEVASKERPHHHADGQTPALTHAKQVKEIISEKKYKAQYEKFKHKYTSVADTPIDLRAKKAYWNASDLRYKESFENAKGKYHTVKDALDIVYHRKVTDDISDVKYKEKYVSQLGIWRSIPDRPEYYHHRAVTDSVSDFKYKEDLTWLKGIGCYAWDTPDFTLAEQNKSLYSGYKYKESFEKTKSKFKYTADNPLFNHFKYATQLANEKLYKADYEKEKTHYSVVVDDPRHLLAKTASEQISQWKYKENYEKGKDKYTAVLDTPENLRSSKASKQISDIVYKLEYNKGKAKGFTSIHDTPSLLHARKVKDRISELKYKELYEKSRGHCTVGPDAVQITTAKDAYKSISNLDYKRKYEATKAQWQWTLDRPDFLQNAKASLQQSDYEYKLDKEYYKGYKLSVTDDKNTVLALKNNEMNSDVKYKKKYEKGTYQGEFGVVADTPQIIHAKSISAIVSDNKYKEEGKKQLPHGTFTTLPERLDTTHVKEVTKLVSDKQYKEKFEKERGKSNYSIMLEPPDVRHAMDVAKVQSNVSYKKQAKANLNYTSIADRPDIQKATQAAKLISDIQYKAKAREEAGRAVSIIGRPDIELAQEVSKLTSQTEYTKGKMWGHGAASYDTPMMRQLKKANELTSNVKYKENFSKDKGKKPQYDLKEAKIYQTFKDAHTLASEVKYKADLKKLHKPVTDMAESLNMQHITSTSKLASEYQYKKEFEKSKGHYHVVPDNLEQLHVKEATELQSQVKYKEKYEKEKGKAMLDFETPTFVTAKEAQHMQSEKEYKKDLEECIKGRNLSGLEVTPALLHVKYATKIASEKEYRKDLDDTIKGRGLTVLEETPELLRAKNATQILNEKEYKKTLETEIKGRGLALALETPDFQRAKNATDIASQIKYKQSAEMDKANYTTVVDTPEIIHAQQVRNLASQKKYKEEAERTMSYYVPVLDTPEMQRVRENQKNFSTLQYQGDLKNIKGKVTVVKDTPEILRVKENQKNFSSILYKEEVGTGTSIGQTPEMERIKRTQDAISTIKYKESIGKGTPIPDLPEVKRVKETQKNISSVLYKESLGQGTPTTVTPEIERVKRNQENISMVMYKENLGLATPVPVTPEIERVKRNQENISSVLYKDQFGVGTPTPVTPEMERVKRNQENISSVAYKENLGKGTPTPVTPEMERVKRNQENISMVLYKEGMGKATPTTVTPEMERVKRNQENISSVLYSDSFRKQIQGRAAYVMDTPEMRRVRESQKHISLIKYHEDFEKQKGSFTPVVTDPVTERVKKNMIDFSDINYRGIQRKVVEMERRRNDQEQDVNDLRVWRTNPGSVFDYDPAEDNIQSRSLHMLTVQARRSREQSRSASALSLSAGDEKSELSEAVDHHHSYYSNSGLYTTTVTGHKESSQILFYKGYKQAKTTELPQQRSSSVATQLTTASSVPSHPSTTGKSFKAMYDYRAADDDEVSFKDGDTIVNVQTIDEGWMYGTVQRTGKTGMLPANYLESI
ncbi:nebulin isoform X30 [Xenopus tropicalis]|uniref:Nebulin isoform X30 n=1 Tax=Xenopus tropicalis TaxID=8364 RepID=A0A8J1IUR7_XENTR|nr:nebulin isoform X30 [Xenopus tropicalis]